MIETGLQNTIKDRNIRMLENMREWLEKSISAIDAIIGEWCGNDGEAAKSQPPQDIEDNKEMKGK